MKSVVHLALPALAMAAAMEPRQAPDVRVVSARTISNGPGSGCPTGKFSFQLNADRTIGTAIFDDYRVSVGPGEDDSLRERFCDFEVTFSFPVGCTTGVIHNSPGGLIRLQDRFEASFASQYSIEKGQIVRPPGEIRYNSTNYGAPPNQYKDFKSDHAAGVRVTVNTATERNVVYRATTRILLSRPSIAPTENSVYDVQNSDVYITGLATC
ncbi:hypothetical protein OQA88_2697 [Cercophora sp. LCS_1]